MKSYDETINTVFNRIDEYKTAQKRNKKIITATAIPMCVAVLIATISMGVSKTDAFKPKTQPTDQGSTEPCEVETESTPNTEQNSTLEMDIIGIVKVDGIVYRQQFNVDETLFTADKYLGDAKNFEGSYQFQSTNEHYYGDFSDITTDLYTVKESKNLMMVKLGNGGTVILGRVDEIIVNGKAYSSTYTKLAESQLTAYEFLGTADNYELIDVPTREEPYISPDDEVWTIKEDDDKLLIKKSNGDEIIYTAE